MSCRAKCNNCMRNGPIYPCKPQDGYQRPCDDCNKVFGTPDCYAHHRMKRYCRNYKMCKDCGAYYSMDVLRAGGQEMHECTDKYCHTCRSYHDPERGWCFCLFSGALYLAG